MRVPTIVFATSGLVIAASTWLTYSAGDRVLDLRDKAEARRQIIDALANLLSTLQDAETGQRGYVITGDSGYIVPFTQAESRLPAAVEALRQLHRIDVADRDIAALEQVINAKMSELRQTIELRRTGGFAAALPMIEAGSGKAAMDRIREILDRMQKQQDAQLREEKEAEDSATRNRTLIFVSTGLLMLFVLGWAFLRIRYAIAERDVALQNRQRERDLLSTTLASIGDCVIVTDVEGRITFMNDIAAAVTGWTGDEVRNRPLREIFRIVNEQTRVPAEDPVEKVIRTGVIVGLANHTVLIRKDGSEVPIDDSGAPIRSPGGKLEGVVLVFRDFSETKRVEKELRDAKENAEQANRAKDQFIAMLSHELRTPLTPVLATLNLWETGDSIPFELRDDVEMLRRNLELEARMIDDLLDLTRIARGVIALRSEAVDVHVIVDLILSLVKSELEGKLIHLNVRYSAERNVVHADPTRLQQVLWNILRNAINFSNREGNVTVETRDEENFVAISIRDAGVGMSAEMLTRVFVPFEQGDRSRSERYGGLGLGMSISRALAEQMGGTLSTESEGPDKGSTFVLRVPSLEKGAVPSKLTAQSLRESQRSRRILLIEDHADTSVALARLLKVRGHKVRTAASIRDALAAFDPEQFDLIICDIGLPDGTGYEFIQTIRQRSKVGAIALTGFGMSSDIDRALEAGFNCHLTKPVDLARLEAAMHQTA